MRYAAFARGFGAAGFVVNGALFVGAIDVNRAAGKRKVVLLGFGHVAHDLAPCRGLVLSQNRAYQDRNKDPTGNSYHFNHLN